MCGEKIAKRFDAQNVERKMRRGRPRMRWENCVKRDLERGEWEENEEQQNIEGVGDC